MFLVYLMGPDYVGGLEADPFSFLVYEAITERNVAAYPEVEDLIRGLPAESFLQLQDKLLFVLSVRNMVIGIPVTCNSPQPKQCVFPSFPAPLPTPPR